MTCSTVGIQGCYLFNEGDGNVITRKLLFQWKRVCALNGYKNSLGEQRDFALPVCAFAMSLIALIVRKEKWNGMSSSSLLATCLRISRRSHTWSAITRINLQLLANAKMNLVERL